jgi:hypothetical protein
LGRYIPPHFFIESAKILDRLELAGVDRAVGWQNIEPQGLAGKILPNKELAVGFEQRRVQVVPSWLALASRILPILHFPDSR